MQRSCFKIVFALIFLCVYLQANAQWNDAQLWTSVNIEKKIIKKLSLTVSEELRFTENITELGEFFTDVGLNYKIDKNWRISGSYRFTNKIRLDNSYSIRHRYYFDLSYRKKWNQLTLIVRTRFQSQYAGINSSETGYRPDYASRNKLSLKYDITSKIKPYLSTEVFIPLNDPEVKGIKGTRYSLGVEWEFIKNSTFDLYYMIQQEYQVADPESDFVTGIGYYYSF